MKTQCLQTNETQHYCRKGKVLEKQGEEEKRVVLIKSLIMRDRKRRSPEAQLPN